jgi:hypothetical protein
LVRNQFDRSLFDQSGADQRLPTFLALIGRELWNRRPGVIGHARLDERAGLKPADRRLIVTTGGLTPNHHLN